MHSCSKLFTCSSWKAKVGDNRVNGGISQRSSHTSVTSVNEITVKLDLKSIYVQYGDGEGFTARVDPTIDALCQPTKQQRVQDLGNSVSMRNTQYGYYGNRKPRSYGNRGHLKNLSPSPDSFCPHMALPKIGREYQRAFTLSQ